MRGIDVSAMAKAQGLAVGVADGFIAAIAASNGMAVATRESAPFVAMGVAVINPWGCVMAGCRMARHAVPCSPMFKP